MVNFGVSVRFLVWTFELIDTQIFADHNNAVFIWELHFLTHTTYIHIPTFTLDFQNLCNFFSCQLTFSSV